MPKGIKTIYLGFATIYGTTYNSYQLIYKTIQKIRPFKLRKIILSCRSYLVIGPILVYILL